MPTTSHRATKVIASGQPSPRVTRYQGVPTAAMSAVPTRNETFSQLTRRGVAVASATVVLRVTVSRARPRMGRAGGGGHTKFRPLGWRSPPIIAVIGLEGMALGAQ